MDRVEINIDQNSIPRDHMTISMIDSQFYKCVRRDNIEDFKSRVLLQKHLIEKLVTPCGNTLLHVAVSYGSDEIIAYLTKEFPVLITTQNSQEDTVLHLAAREGKAEEDTVPSHAIKSLVESNPSTTSTTTPQKQTPLAFHTIPAKTMGVQPPHILLVTFPSQGHINPALQLAKRLVAMGARVTFATSQGAKRRMSQAGTNHPKGLYFASFDDGSEHGFRPSDDIDHYFSELWRAGSKSLADLICQGPKNGGRFTCVVYSNLVPWVAKVARQLNLPSTLLWNQSPALLDILYYYFNGYGDTIKKNINDPSFSLKLPGLPPLESRDLPSFLNPRNTHAFALPVNKEHIEVLDEETNPKVLVNTFDALEWEALNSIGKFKLVGVGPLIPSAFLDGKDPTDTSFGGDLFQDSKDYTEWLNAKPESSVIYISFGSISVVSKPQKEEMARALLDTGRPFLWVIRADGGEEKEEDKLSCREELEKQGKIVPWCSQVEVLSHPSIGCFVTHCGWNSTFESLASGVPVVAFPQWTDQLTNAKMVEAVWETGVRVAANKEGIVEGEEIEKCLELIMGGGERGKEMRKNAKKWKDLARESSIEGGSSYQNLHAFVNEIGGGALSLDI